MDKFRLRVQCSHEHCREKFIIRVDVKYSGRKMKIECPRCFGKLIVKFLEVPKEASPDPVNESVEEGTVLGDIFKTGEGLVTGAHEVVKDLLGKLNREI